MQMLLSTTTILVLFAWAQEEVANLPPAWSPFSAIEAAAVSLVYALAVALLSWSFVSRLEES